MIDNGEIVVSDKAGVYDKTGERELTTDDMYCSGSVSKMFTAAAAMKLVEDGKLDLDKPIVEYMPDFKMADPRYTRITARMLLNHSSGLSGSTLGDAFLLGDNDQSATLTLLSDLRDQPLRFDPGAFSVYCNDGFVLAQILVERVSGRDFTEYIREAFFIPLGMEHTKTSADDFDLGNIVAAYPYGLRTPREVINVIGTGGVYTTAEDLCRFSLALTGERILSKDSADRMMAREYLNGVWPKDALDNTLNYGLGWDSVDLYPYNQYGIRALTKGGGTTAYFSALVVLPEHGLAAAVLSSGGSSARNRWIANALLEGALLEKGAINEKFPGKSFGTEPRPMPAEMKDYAGFYGSSTQVIKVEIGEDGKLLLTSAYAQGNPPEAYFYTGDGCFTNETGEVRIGFAKEGALVYMRTDAYTNKPDRGAVVADVQYVAQKLESHTPDGDTTAAWAAREGMFYFIVNEKYSSVAYMKLPVVGIAQPAAFPGYVVGMRIEDADSAKSVLQIPGEAGRDLRDIEFINEGGVEYILYSDYKAIKMTDIPQIHSGPNSICTIRPDGETRWYSADPALAGKTIRVEAPENASFFVYDMDTGACVANGYAFGDGEAEIPQNAMLGFAGEAGARFVINIR
jgi:CubicO group peptidase (beta-lactamase class C family)